MITRTHLRMSLLAILILVPAKLLPAQNVAQEDKLALDMLKEAAEAYDAYEANYYAERALLHEVYDWSVRWMESQRLLSHTTQEHRKAVRAHLDRMTKLAKQIDALFRVGARGGERTKYYASRFYVAEAKHKLAAIREAARVARER